MQHPPPTLSSPFLLAEPTCSPWNFSMSAILLMGMRGDKATTHHAYNSAFACAGSAQKAANLGQRRPADINRLNGAHSLLLHVRIHNCYLLQHVYTHNCSIAAAARIYTYIYNCPVTRKSTLYRHACAGTTAQVAQDAGRIQLLLGLGGGLMLKHMMRYESAAAAAARTRNIRNSTSKKAANKSSASSTRPSCKSKKTQSINNQQAAKAKITGIKNQRQTRQQHIWFAREGKLMASVQACSSARCCSKQS
jgi:hypothetical protein